MRCNKNGDLILSEIKIDADKIDKLAKLAVHTGLGLQPGQDLLLTAPIEALPLVRRVAIHAYAGWCWFSNTIVF